MKWRGSSNLTMFSFKYKENTGYSELNKFITEDFKYTD